MKFISSLNATAVVVKAGPCQLTGYHLDNTMNTAATYFQFFNSVAPSVGTTTPDICIGIPAGGAANVSWSLPNMTPSFSGGLTVAATTTATGNTNPGTACTAMIFTS